MQQFRITIRMNKEALLVYNLTQIRAARDLWVLSEYKIMPNLLVQAGSSNKKNSGISNWSRNEFLQLENCPYRFQAILHEDSNPVKILGHVSEISEICSSCFVTGSMQFSASKICDKNSTDVNQHEKQSRNDHRLYTRLFVHIQAGWNWIGSLVMCTQGT